MRGERGWRLMGDEFALLDLASGQMFAFPRLISLKNGAISAMRAEADEARFGPLLAATPKGDIRHLIPRSNAVEQMGERSEERRVGKEVDSTRRFRWSRRH